MRFSLRVNNDMSVAEFVRLAQLAEEQGFDQLWVSNDLFLRSAPVLLTAAAGATERLHLGTGIFNPYSMHPAEIAMIAATLQEATNGRFLLGLAAGAEDFLRWAGMERSRPLGRTREAVLAVRALVSGERPAAVEGAGRWTDEAYLRFASRGVPIYLGSMGPKMQALAGELADGVLPLLFPPEHFTEADAHVRRGAQQARRDAEDVDLAACVWVSISADADAARRVLAEKIAYYGPSFSPYLLERAGLAIHDFDGIRAAMAGGDTPTAVAQVTEPMLRLGIAGDAGEVLGRCEWLVDAGARHLSFGPPLGPEPLAAVRELGERVLPAFR